MKVGFNSLLGGASVNHFHWQVWEPVSRLPVESVSFSPLPRSVLAAFAARILPSSPSLRSLVLSGTLVVQGFNVSLLQSISHPVPCLRLQHDIIPPSLAALIISTFAETMGGKNVPHNIVLNATHAFLFPRRPIVYFDNGVRPGFPELVTL